MSVPKAKKVAAALAAVVQHISEMEAAEAAAAQPTAPLPPVPAWGLAGRQDAMLLRNLWQRRLAKSW